MKDSIGNKIVDGDEIITDRGVVLQIVEENGILYMKNSGNNQKNQLKNLDVDFRKLIKKKV